mmetsp:Transcript_18573/g.34177  ORF Transcript_18573/g.34177 Transcript_18573/m.34177 type:complete len:86 (+) Transcript_18573:92-349(+)
MIPSIVPNAPKNTPNTIINMFSKNSHVFILDRPKILIWKMQGKMNPSKVHIDAPTNSRNLPKLGIVYAMVAVINTMHMRNVLLGQ